jgi:hypothetical protein
VTTGLLPSKTVSYLTIAYVRAAFKISMHCKINELRALAAVVSGIGET